MIALFTILSGLAAAHTVTVNFAIRLGADANNTNATLHVNDTDYNTTTPTRLTFINLGKKYISSNNTSSLTGLASAGSLLYIRMNNSYNSTHYLFQMAQDSADNRFLIIATNATASDIDDKLSMIDNSRMIATTIGRFAVAAAKSFPVFIRLEYASIDIDWRSFWSGSGQLRIINRGLTSRNIPNVTIELVKK